MYRLALGRDPEAQSVVEDRLNQPNHEWMPPFLRSSEFLEKVYETVRVGADLRGGHFDAPPSVELRSWAASFFHLAPEACEQISNSTNWYTLFYHLFSDPDFRMKALGTHPFPWDFALFIDQLRARHLEALANFVEIVIEGVGPGEVRGWAIDRNALDRPLLLELLLEDRFAAAGATSEYRDDIRHHYGSSGWHGFRLRYDAPDEERELAGSIREAGTSRVLTTFALPPRARSLDDTFLIRQSLTEVRRALESIEARLPALSYGMSVPLAEYDGYHARFYKSAMPFAANTAAGTVIIDATQATAPGLARSLASLDRQASAPAEVTVLLPDGAAELELRSCLEAWGRRTALASHVASVQMTSGSMVAAVNAVQGALSNQLLLCRAGTLLAPNSLLLFRRALLNGAALVYADSDEYRPDSGDLRHANPRFLTAFDYDLLLQQNYLDGPVAIDRDLLLEALPRCGTVGLLPFFLALRLVEEGRGEAIAHIPRVLSSQAGVALSERSVDERRLMVEAHLRRNGADYRVVRHSDILGASVMGCLRVRREPQPIRVAVIIPTRNRRDLLEPCLTSIFASAPHNRAKLDIIVVDNQSSEPGTLVYLNRLVEERKIRVLLHDATFNWSLINNRAAAATDAEVLVFLNNDTAVLTQDCWDELADQALRPEIGAVGARLLYEDGTIQHAGAVIDGWTSFSRHEGTGQAGRNPGYLGRHALIRRVSTVTGACLATRSSLFHELGGFDADHLPIEGNDTDYCLRLDSHQHAVLYDPYVTFFHFESQSRGYNRDDRSRLQADEASRLLRRRWPDRIDKDPYYNPHFDRLSSPCTRLRPIPY